MADRATWLHRITVVLWTLAIIIALVTMLTVAADTFQLGGGMTFTEANDQITTQYENTPWYMVGSMPLLLTAGPLVFVAASAYTLYARADSALSVSDEV